MSGVALVGVAALWFWSRRSFSPNHRARKMALASVAFLITEALLGAGLVLFNYVDKDQSVGRAFYLSLHLANTLLLLAALALTAWFSRDDRVPVHRSSLVTAALPIAILVCVSGAIAALGDTLFPAASLTAGFHQDFSRSASFLLRLRILHPVLAVLAALYFGGVSIAALRARHSQLAIYVLVLSLAQLCAGALNLLLLAPVWMQITHLLLADLVWIALVLLAVEVRPRMSPDG
jgi:heme a synthase